MLKTVLATRFIKRMTNGRTLPCLIECEDGDGKALELVVKYSGKLFENEKNLAIEAIVAMLAADLGLPVAEPFVVKLEPCFIELVPEIEVKQAMEKSCIFAFGLAHVKHYSAWTNGQMIPKELTKTASEVAVFDQIVRNTDRRPENPNCLFLDTNVLIFDHELTFAQILFWVEPWKENGLSVLSSREYHIFAGPYFEQAPLDFERFILAWEAISDNRFEEYKNALPPSWVYDETEIDKIMTYLKQVRTNIRAITSNALEVLR